jgi:hypothetical protein
MTACKNPTILVTPISTGSRGSRYRYWRTLNTFGARSQGPVGIIQYAAGLKSLSATRFRLDKGWLGQHSERDCSRGRVMQCKDRYAGDAGDSGKFGLPPTLQLNWVRAKPTHSGHSRRFRSRRQQLNCHDTARMHRVRKRYTPSTSIRADSESITRTEYRAFQKA